LRSTKSTCNAFLKALYSTRGSGWLAIPAGSRYDETEASSGNYTEAASGLQPGLGDDDMSTNGQPARADHSQPARADLKPLRADAKRNQQRLLSAAAEVFAERGADSASLEEIARRAGVGIGTLYRHFPTRQALLEAVYQDQIEALRARADELIDTTDPVSALSGWLLAVAAWSKTKQTLVTALMATSDGESPVRSYCGKLIRDTAEDLVTRAQEAGQIRADARADDMLKLTHGISYAADRTPDDDGLAARMLGMVIDGLRVEPS
jgi:AcrR family transcriptional regulator